MGVGGKRLCGCVNFPLLYANGFSLASTHHLHCRFYKPHKEKDENEALYGPHKNVFFSHFNKHGKEKTQKEKKDHVIDFVMQMIKPPN